MQETDTTSDPSLAEPWASLFYITPKMKCIIGEIAPKISHIVKKEWFCENYE